MNVVSMCGLRVLVLVCAAIPFSVGDASAQVTDYGGYRPHYQGFGVDTPGGRGGTVQRVTHLRDAANADSPSWSGSLRKAVTTPGARFVVFKVSGTIALVSPLIIDKPSLTIAGQTAPSPGITLRDSYIQIDTHDVVIQHLRVRPGGVSGLPHGIHVRNGAHRVVLDHVSVSWTVWTAIDLFAQDAPAPNIGDVTLIDSIVSEALSCSGVNTVVPCNPATMSGTPNSRAVLVGDNNTSTTYNGGRIRFAMIRTLSANNDQRHPAIQGDVDTFIINNLIYNPSLQPISAIHFSDGFHRGHTRAVVKGNYVLPGPTTPGYNGYVPRFYPTEGDLYMIQVDGSLNSDTRIYLDGNFYTKHCASGACLNSSEAQWMLASDTPLLQGRNLHAASPPLSLTNLPLSSVMSYDKVEDYVTANAGARPLDRDPVDARVISDVRRRTGRPIHNPQEVGGHPLLAENRRALTVPENPNMVVDAAGRTRIEAWLEAFARVVEPARASRLSAPVNLEVVR